MNREVLEARHLTEKRRAERERDEARAQRDKLAEALRDVMWWRDMHPMNPERRRAEEGARKALAGLENE